MKLLVIGLGLLLCNMGIGQTQKQLNYLFESGTDGYECFRIPAIVTSTRGTVLAFAEGRKKGCSDTGDIDLVMKYSEDHGESWSKLIVIWDDGENVCGNPAPVLDEATGNIYLLSTWNLGVDHEQEIIQGKSRDTRRVFVMSSEDDGQNWSEAREITASVKQENWTWYATGPCHGIQLNQGPHKGRLLIPCDHIEAATKKYFSHSIYSDDHGRSWELGGSTPQDQVNECTLAELSDGRVILNMRNYDRTQKNRKVAFSEDGGHSWGDIVSDKALIEPICQASMLMVNSEEDKTDVLLFLNPADTERRQNLSLRSSMDDGASWSGCLVIHQGPAAYSDLTQLSGGSIACLYEAGLSSPYQGIVYEVITLEQIEKATF